MIYLISGLLAAIAVVAVIAVVRTLLIKAPAPVPCETIITEEEKNVCAQKLAAMVRIPTVSKREDEDLTEFYRFHDVLREQFPLIHEKLKKIELCGTLLYCWQGADSAKKPILFMGHQDVVPASDQGWSYPAYSGAVADGKLYGRGALDCKSTMLVEMQAIEELLAEGFVPPCDVWLEYSINEETGELMIGTDAGLCSYRPGVSRAMPTLSKNQIKVYPNPVRPEFNGMVTISCLTDGADVKIVSAGSQLVASGTAVGGSFRWDVRDASGRRVGSGV